MTVTKRNSTSYRVRVTHKRKRYETVVHGTEDDANMVDTTMQWSLRRFGTWPPPEEAKSILPMPSVVVRTPTPTGQVRKTLADIKNRVLSGVWADEIKCSSQRSRISVWLAWAHAEGIIYPEDFGEDQIQKWVRFMVKRGYSAHTKNNYLSTISGFYREARKSPALTLYKPSLPFTKITHKRDRYITEEEDKALIAFFTKAGAMDMADAVPVAIDTALRRGEILALRKRHLHALDDAKKAAVTVPGSQSHDTHKTHGSYATLPLPDRARKILLRRCKNLGPNDLVFPALTPDKIERWWNMARDSMGLAEDRAFTFHLTRHTTVNRLLDAGLPLDQAGKFARHTDIATTQLYEAHRPQRLEAVRRTLNHINGSGQKPGQS